MIVDLRKEREFSGNAGVPSTLLTGSLFRQEVTPLLISEIIFL